MLRSYGTLYPQSPYVPEAHYLLALTYEQLGQDEESVKELLLLLRESDFNPEMILNLEQGRAMRDRDELTIRRLKNVWNFWKKKTGNYLANKFFEDSEYFNAYRIYSALPRSTPLLPGKFRSFIRSLCVKRNWGITLKPWKLILRSRNT